MPCVGGDTPGKIEGLDLSYSYKDQTRPDRTDREVGSSVVCASSP